VKVDGIMKGLEAGTAMGKLLNDDALYYNLSKLQRVRVIARCETSSYEIC
jgi:hypothetical protein